MLKELKALKPNINNTGFTFSGNDILQWLLDLEHIISTYKAINKIEYLHRNTKLRTLVKDLTEMNYDSDVKEMAKNVLNEIIQPEMNTPKLSYKQQEKLDAKNMRIKLDLELLKKHVNN